MDLLTGNLSTWRNDGQFAKYEKYELAFKFFERLFAAPEKFADGRFEIPEARAFVLVKDNELIAPTAERFEAHKKYIDIQCVISGRERFLTTTPLEAAKFKAYNAEDDYELFKFTGSPSVLERGAGEFVFFFPDNIHQPGCFCKTAGESARKAVAKWPL